MSTSLTRRRFLSRAGTACGAGAVAVSSLSADANALTGTTAQLEDRSLEEYVDGAVEQARREHDVGGVTVAIVDSRTPRLAKGYGHALGSENVPVRADETLFRIGSISKVLTWTAAMQLSDSGRITPDTPVDEPLSSVEIPQTYEEPIRLRHLATHTSGFEARPWNNGVSRPELVQPLSQSVSSNVPERVRPPGELPGYTNYAAALTGQLIADLTGQSYEEYVQENIFDPLGMTNSTFQLAPPALVPAADTTVREATPFYSNVTPASSMHTTATDMARFMQAQLNAGSANGGRILSPRAVEEMHRQWYTPHERLDGIAFGLFEESRGDVRLIRHSGAAGWFAGELTLIPESDTGLFIGMHGVDASEATQQVVDALLERLAPVQADAQTLAPAQARTPVRVGDLSGQYRAVMMTDSTSRGKAIYAAYTQPIDVRVTNAGVLVTEQGTSTDRWIEVGPLVFEHVSEDSALAFRTTGSGNEGQITHLLMGMGAYQAVPRYEQLSVQGWLGALAAVTALTGFVGWPLAYGWRRYRGTSTGSMPVMRARWVAGASIGGLISLVVVVIGLTLALPALGYPPLFTRPPPWFDVVFVLPTIGAALTAGALGYAFQAWYRGSWSLWSRVHYTLVVVGAVVLYWLTDYWNLLWVWQ